MRRVLVVLMAAILVLGAVGCSSSKKPANFPEKSVTMVVPYSAGGSTDLLARAVEKVWSKYVSQPLVVVNKNGAGGIEGREFVVRSKPDGYTIMIGYGSGEDLVKPYLQALPFDTFTDLKAVSRLSVHSIIVAVPANSQFNSLKDVIEWSKKENKPITAAVSTAAGSVDLVMRGIGTSAGVTVTPVPHSGGSQAVTSLIGGQTIMGGGHPSEIMPHVKAGRLKAIGVALPERDPSLPDIPTLKEQGIDFYTWGSVKGIAVPKDTSAEIVSYYEDVFKKISEDPDFKKAMADMLQPIMYQNSKDFTKFMNDAYNDYGALIKELGIKTK